MRDPLDGDGRGRLRPVSSGYQKFDAAACCSRSWRSINYNLLQAINQQKRYGGLDEEDDADWWKR